MIIGLWIVKLIETLFYPQGAGASPIKIVIKRISWNLFYAWVGIIMISRIFILAHFPHQCILAIIMGLFSYKAVSNYIRYFHGTFKKLILAFGILASALLVYAYAELLTGLDVNWSIALAKKYCSKVNFLIPIFTNFCYLSLSKEVKIFWGQFISLSFQKEWIYIDTTPLYAMVRYSGAALGLALSKTSHLQGEYRSWTMKLVSVILGLLIGQAANFAHQTYLKPLQSDLTTFYACEYLLNFFTVSSLISLTNKINAWTRSDLWNNHTFFFCQSLIKKQHVHWRGR